MESLDGRECNSRIECWKLRRQVSSATLFAYSTLIGYSNQTLTCNVPVTMRSALSCYDWQARFVSVSMVSPLKFHWSFFFYCLWVLPSPHNSKSGQTRMPVKIQLPIPLNMCANPSLKIPSRFKTSSIAVSCNFRHGSFIDNCLGDVNFEGLEYLNNCEF